MIIDPNAAVQNYYTFDPWGNIFDNQIEENVSNPYRFAGYFWDDETKQSQCYRRQYDPVIGRFTSRDPVRGSFRDPMTLHAYLYCADNPINFIDPGGEFLLQPAVAGVYSSSTRGQSDAQAIAMQNYLRAKIIKAVVPYMIMTAVAVIAVENWMTYGGHSKPYGYNSPEMRIFRENDRNNEFNNGNWNDPEMWKMWKKLAKVGKWVAVGAGGTLVLHEILDWAGVLDDEPDTQPEPSTP